jgi:rhodanese-related sulfurtransferase
MCARPASGAAATSPARATSRWAQLDKRLSELDKFKEKPIIVVCATGNRSSSACGQLKKHGFGKVYSLGGGVSPGAMPIFP